MLGVDGLNFLKPCKPPARVGVDRQATECHAGLLRLGCGHNAARNGRGVGQRRPASPSRANRRRQATAPVSGHRRNCGSEPSGGTVRLHQASTISARLVKRGVVAAATPEEQGWSCGTVEVSHSRRRLWAWPGRGAQPGSLLGRRLSGSSRPCLSSELWMTA